MRAIQFDDATLNELFGAEDAENEDHDRLKQYFFRNRAFQSLTADLPIRILVGHKGVGKSALLKMAYLQDVENKRFALWIRPDDVKGLWGEKNEDLNRLIEKWKSGIIELIFRKALEQIGQSEDERKYAPTKFTLSALIESLRTYLENNSNKVVDAAAQAIIATYLKNHVITIYIDDLDRGWKATTLDIATVSALLNAIRDTCGNDKRLQFRIGLRSDVYFLVRTSDESTDKIERNIIHLTWDNHDILTVMAKRVATFFGKSLDESNLRAKPQSFIARELYPIIDERFKHVGKWENAPVHRVLLSLTGRRPRDLIKLFYSAGKEAFKNNHTKITTSDLRNIFENYSNERMQNFINEFKSEMPEVARLLQGMRATTKERTTLQSYMYTNDQLNT